MFGALQAMNSIKEEAQKLDPNTEIDIHARCTYPYTWIPPRAQSPQREVLIGAHNILLVIYVIMQDGGVPDTHAIREICRKEEEQLHYTSDYIQCGGSISHILEELTSQVEDDLNGNVLGVEPEDLQRALDSIRPCALDDSLLHWRRALGIRE
ncbi:hypothetical protein GGF46_000043 [Coemansia sp. RSA 552]|nr:hypothetical protein GGF46_000043 [Coemansia sp. RSA 552]